MIKKLFHIFCVLIFGSVLCVLLWLFYALIFAYTYKIDLLSPQTFILISQFWNGGGILNFNDVLMMLALMSYVPCCLLIFYKLSRFKFLTLLTIPYEWWQNRTLRDYKEVSVNIKNLKVEDKKTIEQVVQERLEKEKGKIKQPNKDDIRKNIIEKINAQK